MDSKVKFDLMSSIIDETLAAINDNSLWIHDPNCTREQIRQELIEDKLEIDRLITKYEPILNQNKGEV